MFLSLKKAKRLKPKTILQAQAVLSLVGKKSLHGSGSGGKYWKLNNQVGVKVVGNVNILGKTSNVVNELAMLEKLDQDVPGLFPKPYGLVKVQVGRKQCMALLMEHIDGKPGYSDDGIDTDKTLADEENEDLKAANARLEAAGYCWRDDHAGNIMRENKTGNIRFIDADPRFFS